MATLESWQIIAITFLGVVALLLLALMLLAVFLCLRKRELLCFKTKRKRTRSQRQQMEEERKLASIYQGKQPKQRLNALKRRQRDFSDPFAIQFSDPLHMDMDQDGIENFDITNWDNPLFDVQGARKRDAAITIQSWWRMMRARVRFLELREIALIFQKCWRGKQDRKKIPQYKKEKHERDQKRKKEPGYIRNKGTLSALKFYDVKGYGFCEVQQLYGQETMHKAAEQLKNLYGGKGQRRFKLFISVKAVILYDHHTMRHFATVKMSTISFCSLDFKNKKLFAFINMKKKRKFCHVFQCHEGDAQRLVETMGEAFEVTFKQEKQKKEEERMAAKRRENFHRSAQELDKEVDQMMKLAESASLATPSLNRREPESPRSLTPKSLPSPRLINYHNTPQERRNRGVASTDSPLLISHRQPYDVEIAKQRNFRSLEKGLDNHYNNILNNNYEGRQRSRTFV